MVFNLILFSAHSDATNIIFLYFFLSPAVGPSAAEGNVVARFCPLSLSSLTDVAFSIEFYLVTFKFVTRLPFRVQSWMRDSSKVWDVCSKATDTRHTLGEKPIKQVNWRFEKHATLQPLVVDFYSSCDYLHQKLISHSRHDACL